MTTYRLVAARLFLVLAVVVLCGCDPVWRVGFEVGTLDSQRVQCIQDSIGRDPAVVVTNVRNVPARTVLLLQGCQTVGSRTIRSFNVGSWSGALVVHTEAATPRVELFLSAIGTLSEFESQAPAAVVEPLYDRLTESCQLPSREAVQPICDHSVCRSQSKR